MKLYIDLTTANDCDIAEKQCRIVAQAKASELAALQLLIHLFADEWERRGPGRKLLINCEAEIEGAQTT